MNIENEGIAPDETPVATDDLRSMLTAEFEKVEAPVEAATDTKTEQTEKPVQRQRDATGRFIKADGSIDPDQSERPADKPKAAAAPAKTELTASDKPGEQPVTAPTLSSGPPPSWAADAKATWATLSPAVQQAVLKREQEASNGIRQWSERAKVLDETITPLRALASQKGMDEREGLNRLISAQNALDRDPVNAIKWLAQSYGLDIRAIADGSAPSQQPSPQQFIQPIEQRLMTLEQRIQMQQEAEQAQRLTSLQSEVDKFAADKPHFAAVENEMMAAIPAIKQMNPGLSPQQILDKAYRMAVAANDDVSALVRADETAKADAERKTAAQTKVSQARAASVSIRGAPVNTAGAAAASKGTVRDDLMAAFGG